VLFPNYPAADYRPNTGLVNGYLQYLGEREGDHQEELKEYSKQHLRHIAIRIGRGCLVAFNNNVQAAQRRFRRAKRDLAPAVASEQRDTKIGRTAVHLHLLADLLENRDSLEESTRIRREMHGKTVEDIQQLQSGITRIVSSSDYRGGTRGEMGHLRGTLAQRVALGLITRYAHPWLMAAPSLIHHDNGEIKRHNYDMLVVESMPSNPEPQAYKVQVKTDCAGLCCDRPERRRPQQQYNEDIIIVSACCDLQRGDDRDTALSNFRAADLLVKEYAGEASEEEVRELDAFSDSLILSITMGDERRMGSLPLEQV
jgi:hypothetical protein